MADDPGRVHVVLVPGFAGFDALGQIEYYAGVTPIFREWKHQPQNAAVRADLHYFDNLPTASVATRAARLRDYLAKRIARGEFLEGDEIALVGHSTGGLDIRRLIVELHADGSDLLLDGPGALAQRVARRELLSMIKRVVFLSVPHRGTNIANWVREHGPGREGAVAVLRTFVAAANLSPIDSLETLIVEKIANLRGTNLLLAVRDTLAEMNDGAPSEPHRDEKVAAAQEAASELGLFLTHMASDFGAIDDLAVPGGPRDPPEAVRARAAEHLAADQAVWSALGLEVGSYATLGRCPFRFAAGDEVPPFRLLHPTTWPCASVDPGPDTDVVYRAVYRACAGGPFGVGDTLRAEVFETGETVEIQPWDNDGIVNTASSFLPPPWRTLLVRADHGDIIGHFRLVPAPAARDGGGRASLREHDAYDIFKSDSGFNERTFRAVWDGVFAFCATGTGALAPG